MSRFPVISRPPVPVPPIPTRAHLLKMGVNIVVAIPPPPTIDGNLFFDFWKIAQRGWPVMGRLGPGAAEIHRNQMALHLLRDPEYASFTHICMLDADQKHPPDVVERLARWVLQDPGRLVIGGLYFRKGPPHEPLFRPVDAPEPSLPYQWETRTLFRVKWAATGIMLISRKVFERLAFPWYDYTYPDVSEWRPGAQLIHRSDDTYFCEKAAEAGIAVYLDPTTKSPHIAQTQIGEGNYRQELRERAAKYGPGRIVTRGTVYS